MLASLTRQMHAKGLLESEVKFYYKGCNVTGLTKSVQSFVAPKWRAAFYNPQGIHTAHGCHHSSFSLLEGSHDTVEGSN
jgi:hypothetical protein